jgi:two-component system sensor histidine kinase YesM
VKWLLKIRQLYKQSIQVWLTFYFLVILLPIVLVSLYAMTNSRQELEHQIESRTQLTLSSAIDYIDLYLKNAEDLSTLLATDTNLIELLDSRDSQLTPQVMLNFIKVVQQITSFSAINPLIAQVSIFHMPSQMWLSNKIGGTRLEHMENSAPWLKETLLRNGGSHIFYNNQDFFPELTDNHLVQRGIILGRLIGFNKTTDSQSILFLQMNHDAFQKVIFQLRPSSRGQVYLFNEQGQSVSSTDNDVTSILEGAKTDQNAWTRGINGENMYMVRVESPQSHWSLVMAQPYDEIFQKTVTMQRYIYIIIGVSILMALWISWVVYRSIAVPLRRMFYGIKQVKLGFLDVRLLSEREDEFGNLLEAFNEMAETQKRLINENFEHQIRLTQTELKFMQSQVHPHFLYNTLDSIYWMSQNYDANDISEMVISLSKFFRLSLDKGRQTFTLEETIEHLHYYVRIQQIRFLDRFHVEHEVSEEVKHIELLKLVLQPIVENAIVHGIEKKKGHGQLFIRALRTEGYLILQVEDTGNGMAEERLTYIREQLDEVNASFVRTQAHFPETLFGLRNTKLRLMLYYGDDCSVQIDSQYGLGTKVTISIPWRHFTAMKEE